MLKKPTLVSLFSGAGGLDIGLEEAGFSTIFASDIDKDCFSTLHLNKAAGLPIRNQNPDTYLSKAVIVQGDITSLRGSEIRPEGVEDGWVPDLLVGGPPCQPFSASGKQKSVLDSRGRLFEQFVRIADELKPHFILFENVRGLVTARGQCGEPGEALAWVRKAFEEVGYATSFVVMNAADYGWPQRRVRLFMFASRAYPLPAFPEPTHVRPRTGKTSGHFGLLPWVTLRDFLKASPKPSAEEVVRPSQNLAPLLSTLSDGSGLKSPGRPEPTRPGGHWGYKQGTFIADQSLPARTVTAASTQDWIRCEDGSLRRLTLSECAALQGFPPQWIFSGNKSSQFRQVGNAVPSVFGKLLGGQIFTAMKDLYCEKPVSCDFPEYMKAAIAYTKRDHQRNKSSRVRAEIFHVRGM